MTDEGNTHKTKGGILIFSRSLLILKMTFSPEACRCALRASLKTSTTFTLSLWRGQGEAIKKAGF